jgi:hypothetical protein
MLTEADGRELEAAIKTTEGREQIAQTMYEPFKKGRDYVAIGRQCFAVDHLPAGAPSWYDLDPQFTAAVVGAKGGVNFSEIEATRINVDPQILAVYPKVHVMDVSVRRFNILDREQERAQHEMAKLEDDNFFTAIRNANLSGNDLVNNNQVNAAVTSSAGLSLGSLADGFALVSQFDIPVANVVLHALQTRDIRVWTNRQFDPVTQRELIKTGYIGDIWGAQVRESRRQLSGTINVLGDPQYLGVMSVRIDLSHMDAPDPSNLFYGWVFFEAVGFAQLITVASAEIQVTGKFTPNTTLN